MDAAARNQIRLVILVLLAFLPAVGLYWYANGEFRNFALEHNQEELLRFASVTAVEHQLLVDESESLLGALAGFPQIRVDGGSTCNRSLKDVLAHTPQYTTLSLIGPDGYLACGSLTPEEGLYLGDRAYYQRAQTTGGFAVGRYAVGRITGKPTLGVAYPLLDDEGNVGAVLAASIDLTTLGAHAARMELPADATLTILDHDGTVLVRVPKGVDPTGADTVGARVQETFPTLTEGAAEPYVVSGQDLDGVYRLFAVSPLRGGSMGAEGYVLVGRDETTLYAEADEVVRGELGYLAVAGIAVLILAWFFGHFALVRTATPVNRTIG